MGDQLYIRQIKALEIYFPLQVSRNNDTKCIQFLLFLGPFLLTNLLLEDLKKVGGEENGDARIVNVTSSLHDPESIRRKTSMLYLLFPAHTCGGKVRKERKSQGHNYDCALSYLITCNAFSSFYSQ